MRKDRQYGILVCCAGVFCVTPDAVLMRWAQALDASVASILFWKFTFVAIFSFAWVLELSLIHI